MSWIHNEDIVQLTLKGEPVLVIGCFDGSKMIDPS